MAAINTVYDQTVTQTDMITVTVGIFDIPATHGPLSFAVVDGTTSWLGGKTPIPDEPIVYISSVVTVLPIPATEQRTTTLKSTIQLTSEVTVTSTLPESKTSPSSESSPVFTAVPSGGWNISTIVAHVTQPGLTTAGTVAVTSAKPTLVTDEPSFDLHPTTRRSDIYISSYAAQSGFKKYTTLTAPEITTTSKGGSSTAVVGGRTYSWIIPTASPSTTQSFVPPCNNTTYSTSRSFSVPSTFSTTVSSVAGNATNISSTAVTRSPNSVNGTSSLIPASSSAILGSNTLISASNTSGIWVPSSVVATASATPSNCGIIGDFTLTVSSSSYVTSLY